MGASALVVVLDAPTWSSRGELDRIWTRCMKPLLEGLEQEGRLALLLSGGLLEACLGPHAADVERIRVIVQDRRIELLTTAMHQPVASSVPERDLRGQFTAHTTLLKRIFGVRPRGAWVPHLTWDTALPRILHKCGLGWTLLPRDWLADHGVATASVLAVEREGRMVRVLPFGSGPGVRVRWLSEDNVADVVALAKGVPSLPSELARVRPTRAYLPSGGPTGIWERTLLDDPGADVLHKRMLVVSSQLHRFVRSMDSDPGADPHVLHQARRYLYRSQAAEAFGPVERRRHHGSFRDRAWRDLCRAEGLLSVALDREASGSAVADLDFDGIDEVRLWTPGWAVGVAPGRQGVLTEITHVPSAANIVCGDAAVAFRESWGMVPVALEWALVTVEKPGDGRVTAVLCADSSLGGVPVRVTKWVRVAPEGPVRVRIEVENRGPEVVRGHLVTEMFLTLGGPLRDSDETSSISLSVDGLAVPLDERVELPEVGQISVIGWRVRAEIEPDPAGRFIAEPLDNGAARVTFSWPVELWSREKGRRMIAIGVREEPRG